MPRKIPTAAIFVDGQPVITCYEQDYVAVYERLLLEMQDSHNGQSYTVELRIRQHCGGYLTTRSKHADALEG